MDKSLEERVAAIEARQRAYGIHDPDCLVFLRLQAQKETGAYLAPELCSCWLSLEPLR